MHFAHGRYWFESRHSPQTCKGLGLIPQALTCFWEEWAGTREEIAVRRLTDPVNHPDHSTRGIFGSIVLPTITFPAGRSFTNTELHPERHVGHATFLHPQIRTDDRSGNVAKSELAKNDSEKLGTLFRLLSGCVTKATSWTVEPGSSLAPSNGLNGGASVIGQKAKGASFDL